MGFTMRIWWYHHIHILIMGYAFTLFIHFVRYEERLLRPPCCHLNRFRLRSRSVPNKASSSHQVRHQCIKLFYQNPWGYPIYRGNSHECTWHCHRNFNNNHCTILYGNNCTHRNCNNYYCPDLFPLPTSYIDSQASHISFLSPASLPSSCLSASPEYYFTALIFQQHHLLHMSIPITCPHLVHPESPLEILQMESSSPMLYYPSTRTCQNMSELACLMKTMP